MGDLDVRDSPVLLRTEPATSLGCGPLIGLSARAFAAVGGFAGA